MFLEIADVHDYARVKLNGKELEAHAWQPYRWEVTNVVKAGSNDLEVEVRATAGGRGGFGGPPPAPAAAPGAGHGDRRRPRQRPRQCAAAGFGLARPGAAGGALKGALRRKAGGTACPTFAPLKMQGWLWWRRWFRLRSLEGVSYEKGIFVR